MTHKLVFTQLPDGRFMNHGDIKIPIGNPKVKHTDFVKSGVSLTKYKELQKELGERIALHKAEREGMKTKQVPKCSQFVESVVRELERVQTH